MIELPQGTMPEAEVSLRFACSLIESEVVVGEVDVALDGAQVRTGETVHFPVLEFRRTQLPSAPQPIDSRTSSGER